MWVGVFRSLVLGLCIFVGSAHGSTVLFLNPGHAAEPFWSSYSQFMQVAADQLGMDLTIQYSERVPSLTVDNARAALHSARPPDYLVFVNEQSVGPQILRMAQGTRVKVFMVNNGLTPGQAQLISENQRHYAPLLGSLLTNDEQAGYLMLNQLVAAHGPLAPGQALDLLAFSGVAQTPASILREQGMRRALAEHPQVHLRQRVYGAWDRERAYQQAGQLLKRYPRTALVWSANDEMAFGAMRALQEQGRMPGKDVLFSAVNTSPQTLQARIDGRLSVLFGGHFTLGGWALVLLHDDALGVDFSRHGGRDRSVESLRNLDPATARQLLAHGVGPGHPIDFNAMSAKGKPVGYRYPFSLDAVLP
ncbi:MAG: ABC transporter substrate-binding protein [Pseudomonas sp.]|nr:ABC transporter substrate-binding protein [Pseudomonas sp.]